MVGVEFFGNFDLASAAIWSFWLFFAGLVFYLQVENMREGYPLETDEGEKSPNQGPFPQPEPKTFVLPHGRGSRTVPNDTVERRDLPMAKDGKIQGLPFEPTGDPMKDGVGPASWAPRRDMPELDGKGHPKIVPMGANGEFKVAAGRDPRGMPVIAGDGEVAGTISDMWVDEPEQLVRYLEVELSGGGKRLIPIQLARLKRKGVYVHSIHARHFPDIPPHKSESQVTMLEEEKISGFIAGGKLYADRARLEPQL